MTTHKKRNLIERCFNKLMHFGSSDAMLSKASTTRERFVQSIPRDDGLVLEIGPFTKPALTGPNVRYADKLSAGEIKAEALRLGKDASQAPQKIHYTSDLSSIEDRFAAVYSSHCIEHTCDLIGHLQQIERVLTDRGQYFLVIPDKRFCFDYYKETSTIGSVIEAYERQHTDYDLKLWVDRTWIGTHADAKRHWKGDHGSQNKVDLARRIRIAINEYRQGYRLPTGPHVWCFTPESFAEIVSLLHELGYIKLRVIEIYPTRRNALEFYAVLGFDRVGPSIESPSPQGKKEAGRVDTTVNRRAGVNYHVLRQHIFEHSLLLMEGVLGRKGTLIDLGAGHCAFSLMARAMGWQATALDVRTARVPDLPEEIRFLHGDIDSDAWTASDYDLIVCLGVYYHLDQDMQHRLLKKCRGKPLIIDTHFANPKGLPTRYISALSETYEKNGETGADYREARHLSDEARKTADARASFDNPTSWWQTKESLLDTLHDYGWPHIWAFDHNQMAHVQRTFFVCYAANEKSKGVSGIRI